MITYPFEKEIPKLLTLQLVVELHPEEVLGVALGHVVDDVLVVEEGGVGGRLLRHALPVRHPRAPQLGELLGVRVRLA